MGRMTEKKTEGVWDPDENFLAFLDGLPPGTSFALKLFKTLLFRFQSLTAKCSF